jgi:hypothetical protein
MPGETRTYRSLDAYHRRLFSKDRCGANAQFTDQRLRLRNRRAGNADQVPDNLDETVLPPNDVIAKELF